MAADGVGQLRLIREKLESVASDDPWFEALFPEAIFELEKGLSEGAYVEFLEDLRATRPDVFKEGADWHTRSMAFYYVAQERWPDLDLAIRHLADGLREVHEAYFSLMSIIRLAGRRDASQQLIDAAIRLETFGQLMPWAVNELMEWAMCAPYQACVQAGCTAEAIDSVHDYALKIGAGESEQVRQNRRDFALHLAGKADAWNRDVLLKDDRHSGRRIYLLGADFMRWLCVSRGIEPLVADELRRILMGTIDGMECSPTAVLRGLRRQDFEPVLARKLGFMSLDTAHAPAGIVAMRQFYDFLAESELVEPNLQKSAHALNYALWKDLKRALKDDWRHYQFLERLLPRLTEPSH